MKKLIVTLRTGGDLEYDIIDFKFDEDNITFEIDPKEISAIIMANMFEYNSVKVVQTENLCSVERVIIPKTDIKSIKISDNNNRIKISYKA
jgi:hypothetical protein